jgi:hypothetical protein
MKKFTGWPRSPLKFFQIGKKGKETYIKCVTKIGNEETLDLFEVKRSPCVFCDGFPQSRCEWCLGTDKIFVLRNYDK